MCGVGAGEFRAGRFATSHLEFRIVVVVGTGLATDANKSWVVRAAQRVEDWCIVNLGLDIAPSRITALRLQFFNSA